MNDNNSISRLIDTQDFWGQSNRLAGLLVAFGDHVTDERCEICGDSENTSEERSPRRGRLVRLCRRCCVEETGYEPKNAGSATGPEVAA